MPGRIIRYVAPLSAAALLLTGCTAPAAVPPKPAVPRSVLAATTEIVAPQWGAKVALVGTPVVRNGLIASYVRGGSTGLQVRAWQLADGTELWRRSALVGDVAPGVDLDLDSVRFDKTDYVTFLAPNPADTPSELVVVAMASGEQLALRDPVVAATARPSACGDAVCFEGWSLGTQRLREPARPLRVDLRSGRFRIDRKDALPRGAFGIGEGLFAVGDPQRLGYATGGTTRWTRPYADVFGARATTAGGWTWHRVGELLIGIGGREGVVRHGAYVYDLASAAAVALDRRTGRTRWRVDHATYCRDGIGDTWSGEGVVQLCRASGTLSTPSAGHRDDTVGTQVRFERLGVRVSSGRILWRRREPSTIVTTDGPRAASRTRWLPAAGDRPQLVDRVTGTATSLPADAVLGCSIPRELVRARYGGKWDEYVAGDAMGACSGTRLSRFVLETAAVDGGHGWWVVPGATTLSAYRLSERGSGRIS